MPNHIITIWSSRIHSLKNQRSFPSGCTHMTIRLHRYDKKFSLEFEESNHGYLFVTFLFYYYFSSRLVLILSEVRIVLLLSGLGLKVINNSLVFPKVSEQIAFFSWFNLNTGVYWVLSNRIQFRSNLTNLHSVGNFLEITFASFLP